MTSIPAADELAAHVQTLTPWLRATLEDLVRQPSISADADPAPLRATASAVAALFREAGATARFLEVPDAPPAVLAEVAGPPGAPTVLLYAHYDVQPPGDLEAWSTPPFEPVERAGRLYGRGASDDKSGVITHLGALRAFNGHPPVHIKVFIEGEEELGSPHLTAFLETHRESLAADVIVIADLEHMAVGQPALTTSLRGLIDCYVEVRVLEAGVHSGQFGGPLPDALSALSRLLATLHHDDGAPAVAGLRSSPRGTAGPSEAEVRANSGALPGVHLLGKGPLGDRLWRAPAISVLAIDAPAVADAVNLLVASARAKVSVRLAPGDEPARAMDALIGHLEAHAPWGAQVTVTRGASAWPFEVNTAGAACDAFREGMRTAWGVEALEMGMGGTVPFVAEIAQAFPQATVVLTGVGDPTSRIHGPDESQDLRELERNVLAEAIALARLGR
ncbi:MAG: dipeptidase [Dehalococcoidia bacterium]|nr:dipeptidase [Dehalococcoidia bacterium]